ncbi:hypothetical protein L6164_008783 [Bauhinia variegata]|uniref:Uncharacterized protein n=1 Tax=Bauhinia variegata TaxID=167791 RepID=A0ACB9PNC8_BAUVA|nr:hypothetical protein L6164_008783 [Bauhinia variegata]
MVAQKQALTLLLAFSFIFKSSLADNGAGIPVYWGQDTREGSLRDACNSPNYNHVILSCLNAFGCGRNPAWNFAAHCSPSNYCNNLEQEIQYCQKVKSIKVLLSNGGAIGDYSLCSPQDAQNFADYLYHNFLSGQYGRLGNVVLDGIDFHIEDPRSNLYYDDLAQAIKAYSTIDRKIYVAASPRCPFPDRYLDAAIRTGHFDYIYVQFYDNPSCEYFAGNTANLFRSRDSWTSSVQPSNTVFLGLPANLGASLGCGYIPPNELINTFLPYVKKASNYGGVALSNRYWDIQTNPSYSDQIKPYISKSA